MQACPPVMPVVVAHLLVVSTDDDLEHALDLVLGVRLKSKERNKSLIRNFL